MSFLLFILFQFSVTLNAYNDCMLLKQVYPSSISKCTFNEMVLKNQEIVPFYNKENKTFEQRLMNADVYSLFYLPYDYSGKVRSDAGRIRSYPLLKITYGSTKKLIEKNLITVQFYNKKLRFNKKARAALALKKVWQQLKKLISKKPYLKEYLKNSSSYYYRRIAGSALLSAHSFGIAIDLNPKKGHYWRWQKKGKRLNNFFYPQEIVAIFEAHGFIWGGRWKHYDSFHFEYCPQFLYKRALKKGVLR